MSEQATTTVYTRTILASATM